MDLAFTDQKLPARATCLIILCCSKCQIGLLALGKQRAADSPPRGSSAQITPTPVPHGPVTLDDASSRTWEGSGWHEVDIASCPNYSKPVCHLPGKGLISFHRPILNTPTGRPDLTHEAYSWSPTHGTWGRGQRSKPKGIPAWRKGLAYTYSFVPNLTHSGDGISFLLFPFCSGPSIFPARGPAMVGGFLEPQLLDGA